MTTTMLRSPLHGTHVAAGARMVPFAGWEMPVQYTGILDEHRAVRESVGMFDISHMGEFSVVGAGACSWLDSLLTNRISDIPEGSARYTLMLNERGGVIDDLIAYRLGPQEFFLIVNAAKIPEDAEWMRSHIVPGVEFSDLSPEFAAIAVQGPNAARVHAAAFGAPMPEARNRISRHAWRGVDVLVATTGYTGEDGFEAVVPVASGTALWQTFLDAGVKPCGLGARDTLRLEMGYPLNGNDLSPDRTPLEAGLSFFVDLSKPGFIGKSTLDSQKAAGLTSKLVAIEIDGKSPPLRPHYPVLHAGQVVGETSSGALSPSLGTGIAMAYLPIGVAKIGTAVEVEVRGKCYPATIKKKPLYRKPTHPIL